MKKNLVSYNSKENFEVDFSSVKELSVPGRVTLFVSRGGFELNDEEFEVLKKHPCWKHCFHHEYPTGINPEKVKEEEEEVVETPVETPVKKTLSKKKK